LSIKPKIGIIFITSEWFRDIGLQDSSSLLTNDVDKIANSIVENISTFSEPIYNGVISSYSFAKESAIKIKEAGADLLLIAPLMWCEDNILRAVLRELPKIPIILCTIMPYESFSNFMSFQEMLKGSGTVGSQQISGFLRKDGFIYESIAGYFEDPDFFAEIKKHSIAIAIKNRLKNVKCGILPFRCDQMAVTYVDEFNIHKLYGIELKYLELQRIKDIAQRFEKSSIDEFKSILDKLGFIVEVNSENLEEAIKYSLALERVIEDENLKVLAMNDVINEMHSCFGLRPCLVNPKISREGVMVSMEADVAAGIAMHILHEYTGDSPLYTEILCADLIDNTFLMGHAGYHDYVNYDPDYPLKIISDPEYKNSDRFTGACLYYKYKPGPISIINSIYDGEKLRWVVIEGESLPGPLKLEGNSHVYCRIMKPITSFYRETVKIGISQHWLVVYGHFMKDLKVLCDWNNIEYIMLDNS